MLSVQVNLPSRPKAIPYATRVDRDHLNAQVIFVNRTGAVGVFEHNSTDYPDTSRRQIGLVAGLGLPEQRQPLDPAGLSQQSYWSIRGQS